MRRSGIALTVAVAAVVLAGGCSSTWNNLHPQSEMPEYAARAAVCAALPNHTGRTVVARLPGHDLELSWRETRAAGGDYLVVHVHGVFSSRHIWDYVVGELGWRRDLLLVDLLGCGDSSKPDPGDVPPGTYGPDSQARLVWVLIRERLAAADGPRRVAIVGHSFGGMVALRMLGNADLRAEYAAEVARVDRVVLLAPVDFAVEKIPPDMWSIAHVGGFEIDVARVFGLLREVCAEQVAASSCRPEGLPRELVADGMRILSDRASRRAMQRMIQEAVPYDEETRRPVWTAIETLVRDYAQVDKPTLILWGARDESWPVSMGYKLRAQLPDAWLEVLPERMHLLPSDAPEEVADAIDGFLQPAFAGRPRIVDPGAGLPVPRTPTVPEGANP